MHQTGKLTTDGLVMFCFKVPEMAQLDKGRRRWGKRAPFLKTCVALANQMAPELVELALPERPRGKRAVWIVGAGRFVKRELNYAMVEGFLRAKHKLKATPSATATFV